MSKKIASKKQRQPTPNAGGSYRRDADGKLSQTRKPTAPAAPKKAK